MTHAQTKTGLQEKRLFDTKAMVVLALLTACAFLSVFLIRIPMFEFLKYEPKDIFITLGGFLYGPIAVVCMSVTVSFLEMVTISTTGPIGMLMNVIATVAFSATASIIYRHWKKAVSAYAGLVCGALMMTGVMLLWNYLISPMYMNLSREALSAMLVPVFLPFNLIKSGLNAVLISLLYTPFLLIMKQTKLRDNTEDKKTARHANLIFAGIVTVFLLVTCAGYALVLH